jgi:DNA repair protein RAD7
MTTKAKPLPGQMANCALCDKRFTVTPYSRSSSDGGLLCVKCSKELEQEEKASKTKKRAPTNRVRQRQTRSELLSGVRRNGAKSLVNLCVEAAVKNIDNVYELGDLPDLLLDKLAATFSKRYLMDSRLLALFLRADRDQLKILDAASM